MSWGDGTSFDCVELWYSAEKRENIYLVQGVETECGVLLWEENQDDIRLL